MKIKDLIEQLKLLPQESYIFHANDEEMRIISFLNVDQIKMEDYFGEVIEEHKQPFYCIFPDGEVDFDEVLWKKKTHK